MSGDQITINGTTYWHKQHGWFTTAMAAKSGGIGSRCTTAANDHQRQLGGAGRGGQKGMPPNR